MYNNDVDNAQLIKSFKREIVLNPYYLVFTRYFAMMHAAILLSNTVRSDTTIKYEFERAIGKLDSLPIIP